MSESTSQPTTTSTAPTSTPGAATSTSNPTSSPTSPTSPTAASAAPTPTPTSAAPTKLIAVAFSSLDPSTKTHKLRPAVASSLSPITIIASSPSAASAHAAEGVVAAFNAATDLVMHLDEQLSHPPSIGETMTGLFRPASAELGGRLKKMGDKVKAGKVKVPVGKGGEAWEGERRVEGMNWEEFNKVFKD